MGKIDLHTHTSYSSDGEIKPARLVEMAVQKSLSAIAITDHNTMDGVAEAVLAGRENGLEVLPGIEIDTIYEGRAIHIIGYYLAGSNPENLFKMIKDMKKNKIAQARKRIERLNELGFEITFAEAVENAKDIPVGVVLAETIITNGRNDSHPLLKPYLEGGDRSDQPYLNFNNDFFVGDGLANIPAPHPRSDLVISAIKEGGGLPVLAHPGHTLNPEEESTYRYIEEFIEAGLLGIEVYSSYHNDRLMADYARIARKFKLLITAGSDFHGSLKPRVELGGIPNNDYRLLTKILSIKK